MPNNLCERFDDDPVFYKDHSQCAQCGKFVCIRNADGTSDCTGCDHEHGEMLHDPSNGMEVDPLHDDCREKYTLELAVTVVENALKVRLPLGMEVWAAERARNVVTSMLDDFEIKLKG